MDKIKDSEIEEFVQNTYKQQLEDEILQSSYGQRIKGLEKLGIGITLEEAIDRYIAIAGMPTDKSGNIIIDDSAMSEVYQENLGIISKQIGYDITQFSLDRIENIIENSDYAFQITKDIRNEENRDEKEIYKLLQNIEKKPSLKEICGELNIKTATYATSLDDFSKILLRKGIGIEDVENHIRNYEKNTLNTFIETFSDMKFIELSMIACEDKKGNMDFQDPETKNRIINELGTCIDSKYYKEIINENGQIDFDKFSEFFPKFVKERNAAELDRKISKYSTTHEITDIDMKKDIFITLLRAYKSNNDIQIRNGIDIAKNLGFDIINQDGNFDIDKIDNYGRMYFGEEFDIDDVIHRVEFNEDTIEEHFDRIEQAIMNEKEISGEKTVNSVNEYKAKQREKEAITCSKKEKIARSILNGVTMTPEEVIAVYCKFRAMERNERRVFKKQLEPQKFDARFVNGPQEYGVANIIKKYILENREQFSEYLTEAGEFQAKKVMMMLENKDFSVNQQMNITSVFDEVRRQSKKIDKNEREHEEEIQNFKKDVKRIKTGELSEEEKEEIFKKAKHLQKDDLLTTEILEELKNADSEMFDKTFKKSDVVAKVQEGSMKAFLYGKIGINLRKAFVVLPQRLFKKETRLDYMPGIDRRLMEKFKAAKEKMSEKIILGNLKEYDDEIPSSNLPAVKKESIFDKIRRTFSKKEKNKNTNVDSYGENDFENTQPSDNPSEVLKAEDLTIDENFDTSIAQKTSGLEYIKVDETPKAVTNKKENDKNDLISNQIEVDLGGNEDGR
ncbi:MAG: hypothetical protein IKL55_02175 [Clostridia bacterium]|nr:hypothetical protein [Clostridia bacterium]